MLSDLTSQVVNKYAGAIGEKWGAEFALAFALVAVIGTRVMDDASRKPKTIQVDAVQPIDFPTGTDATAPTGIPNGPEIYATNS